MIGFFIGMLAFALWAGVMVGIYRTVKANPGHPFWSMARFKNARRSIAPSLTPSPSDDPLELAVSTADPIELGHFDELDFQPVDPLLPPHPVEDLLVLPDSSQEDEEEFQEVEAMLHSIAAPKRPRPPRAPRQRATGPIRSGRLTYVLVDDEGRPEL